MLLKNFKLVITKKRSIFVLFALSIITSILAVMYIYTIFSSIQSSTLEFDQKFKTVKINFLQEEKNLQSKIDKLLKDRTDIFYLGAVMTNSNEMFTLASYTKKALYYGGRYFNDHSTNEIILSSKYYETYHDKSQIHLYGKDYNILSYSDRNFNEIPFSSITETTQIEGLYIQLSRNLSILESQNMEKKLNALFTNSIVMMPMQPDIYLSAKNLYSSIISILVVFLALINISFLYQYLLFQRRKHFAIYQICGFTKLKVIKLLASELFILSSGVFVLAVLIYQTGIKRLLPYINDEIFQYRLGFNDFIVLYLFFIFAIAIVFFPVIINFCRKTPISLLKK